MAGMLRSLLEDRLLPVSPPVAAACLWLMAYPHLPYSPLQALLSLMTSDLLHSYKDTCYK